MFEAQVKAEEELKQMHEQQHMMDYYCYHQQDPSAMYHPQDPLGLSVPTVMTTPAQMVLQPHGSVAPAQQVHAAPPQNVVPVDSAQQSPAGENVAQPQYVDQAQGQMVYQAAQPQQPQQYQVWK